MKPAYEKQSRIEPCRLCEVCPVRQREPFSIGWIGWRSQPELPQLERGVWVNGKAPF